MEMGESVSEWKECTLGEAPLEILDGDRGKNYPPQEEFLTSGHCIFLSTKNVRADGFDFSDCQYISRERDELLRKGKIKRNDIVLTTRGTIGNIGFFDESVQFEHIRINSGMVIIRPNEKILLPSFNYYLFRKLQSDFHVFVSGSAQPQLPIRDLKEIEILLPLLPEQRAIAAVLSSLDDKIDLLHRQNKTLEAMAETLFRQWFVEDAGENWDDGTLGNVIYFYNGKSRPVSVEGGTIPIYGGNGVLGHTTTSNTNGVSIIVGRVGAYYGSLYVENRPIWITDNALSVKPKITTHTSYVYYLLKSLNLNQMAQGSSHPLLTQTLLNAIEVVIPPVGLVSEFCCLVDGLLIKAFCNKIQIQTLEKLRDNLLPKIMSGDVRIATA